MADHSDRMSQLRDDELLQGEAARVRRSGQAEHESTVVYACDRAGHHRGAADLRVRQGTEELAEPRERLLEERQESRNGDVAGGEPRAAIRDDRVAGPRGLLDGIGNLLRLVLHNRVEEDRVTGPGKAIPDELPRRIP